MCFFNIPMASLKLLCASTETSLHLKGLLELPQIAQGRVWTTGQKRNPVWAGASWSRGYRCCLEPHQGQESLLGEGQSYVGQAFTCLTRNEMPPRMHCSRNHDGQSKRKTTAGTLRVYVSTDEWKPSSGKQFVIHPSYWFSPAIVSKRHFRKTCIKLLCN